MARGTPLTRPPSGPPGSPGSSGPVGPAGAAPGRRAARLLLLVLGLVALACWSWSGSAGLWRGRDTAGLLGLALSALVALGLLGWRGLRHLRGLQRWQQRLAPGSHWLQPHRRLRAALFLMIAFAGLETALHALSAQREQGLRAAEADLIDRAGSERLQSQQLGRLLEAAHHTGGLTDAGRETLNRLLVQGLHNHDRLQALLLQLSSDAVDKGEAADALQSARRHWATSRAALLAHAEALARDDQGQGSTPDLAPATTDTLVARYLEAAQALVARCKAAATLRHAQVARLQAVWTGLTLTALLGLLLGVAEPVARAVHRQYRQQSEQALQLQELARRAQRALADERVAAIAFDSLQAIAITDADQAIVKVNPAFTRITGYSPAEAVGQRVGRLLRSGRHGSEFYTAMYQALTHQRHWQGEIWNRRKNGETYPERLSITAVTDDTGATVNYVAVFSDISLEKQADRTIHHLAFFDALTELPNRRLLRDRLGQVVAANARHGTVAALLFIDLDHFKELNDTRGHHVGDELLVAVARRLLQCLRSEDTVARQGGDEFVVIACDLGPDTDTAACQAEAVAEKIRAALNQPYRLSGLEYHGTPSIGVSLIEGADVSIEDVLQRADVAMYQSKRSGRNAVRFFDPAVHAAMQARVTLEADLRGALAAGQFSLHLQQQVGPDGRPIGAEALLRWQHPQRGWVPPSDFISVAEDTGLIVPIGRWVLEEACRILGRWAAHGPTAGLQLAVNVSARQFRQPDFVEQVQQALLAGQAEPQRLKLELTESLVLVNLADTVAKMQAIKALGARFSIDDFGTGQSSLAYLTRLPIDQLKIDQSFVRNMLDSRTDAVIVQTIIGMAQSLGLEVIAEGVETLHQRQALADWGCHAFQGYLFGRPVAAGEFDRQI